MIAVSGSLHEGTAEMCNPYKLPNDHNNALSVSNIEAGRRVLASKTHCLKNTLVLRTGSCATWV